MIDVQKERRIGQILLICKIIQMENKDLRSVSKIHVTDIQKWLDADEQYVATLINVCASFDRRNIADDVLNNMHIYDMEKRFYLWDGLSHIWKCYLDYQLKKLDKQEFESYFRVFFREAEKYSLSKELLMDMIQKYATELIFRVHKLAITNMSTLDIVLEIAEMDMYSEEEYLMLRKMLLDIEDKGDDSSKN